MIYLHICSSLKDDPQRAVAVKCDTKHYSFYPSGPHKNWHCNVFHRLMPRMCWGWLTGLSSLNLFLINMHSHSHDLCDGHRVVTHASQRCSVCSSEREREAARSKGTQLNECTCHISVSCFSRIFQILITTSDPDLVELFGGTVSLLMSWKGLIWVIELVKGPPVKSKLTLIVLKLSAGEFV